MEHDAKIVPPEEPHPTAFVLFLVIIAISEGINLWQNTMRLPIDQYRLPDPSVKSDK
jgi:hypothetical protein